MLISLAALIGSMQLNMTRRAQGHPGSNPGSGGARARRGARARPDFARRRVPIEVSQKNAFMEGWERAELHMIRRPCWYNDKH